MLLTSLITYHPNDPSFNSVAYKVKPQNACGYLGSFLSDLLLQVFGLAAFVMAGWMFLLARLAYKNELSTWRDPQWIAAGFLALNFSALISFYFPNAKAFSENILLGGIMGTVISAGLQKISAHGGSQIFLWSSFIGLFIFVTERNLKDYLQIEQIQFFKKKTQDLVSRWKSLFLQKNKQVNVVKAPTARSLLESVKKGAASLGSSSPKISGAEFSSLTNDEHLVDEVDEDDLEVDETETDSEEDAEEPKEYTKRRVVMRAKPPRRVANWTMPKIDLFEDPPASRAKIDKTEISRKAESLVEKLKNFKVEGEIVGAKPGPLVTMYEFRPNADVKISNITQLEDDLSLALSSESVRVVGHIPGTDVVGIETANAKRETVYYKDLIAQDEFWNESLALPMAIGRAVDGQPKIVDLRKMPHLLIAGTTGSGKSVFVGSIIAGFLLRHSPKTLKLVLIDPKMVDLAPFATIPHLALPHVTDPKKATASLRWAVREMEKRYKSMAKFAVGKLEAFNEKVAKLTKEQIEEHEQINNELEDNRQKNDLYYFQPLPFIVIFVDELADLMIVEKANIEEPIQRLTQKARACGIHLVIATQSPRKDVVTGLIKTNIPGRVALKVSSKMDSRIIIDDSGAERLLPNGDMLYQAPGIGKPMRHHGPFLTDSEIQGIVEHWSRQGEPDYDPSALRALEGPSSENSDSSSADADGADDSEYDDRYDEILSWVSGQKEVSASLIQRKFRLGYPRAARMIEVFEREGVVGPNNGSKPRQVLITSYKDS